MTFDEAGAYITNELHGRTVERVERKGKELVIVCKCGHEVVIQSDVNHDIQFVRTDVKIVLPGIDFSAAIGAL